VKGNGKNREPSNKRGREEGCRIPNSKSFDDRPAEVREKISCIPFRGHDKEDRGGGKIMKVVESCLLKVKLLPTREKQRKTDSGRRQMNRERGR